MTRIFIFILLFDNVNNDFVNKTRIRKNINISIFLIDETTNNTIKMNDENEKRNRCREITNIFSI